jgi:Putative transposase
MLLSAMECHGYLALDSTVRQLVLAVSPATIDRLNARILGSDRSHVTLRWKDRSANGWRTEWLPGVQFLRRLLQHVLPRGFHKLRNYGLWHPSKRDDSRRAWVLLILTTPAATSQPLRMAGSLLALTQSTELTDQALNQVASAIGQRLICCRIIVHRRFKRIALAYAHRRSSV